MKNSFGYFKYSINTRSQGKDQLIYKMYDHISAFQMKLGLWEQQFRKNFTHFPTLSLQLDVTQETADKFASLISDLYLEFENQDFKKRYVVF